MTHQEVARLHPADISFFLKVEEAAWRIARLAKLPLRRFSPLPKRQTEMLYGICYTKAKHVQLAVRYVNARGAWMPYREDAYKITTMLCHELAHLEQANHGPKFLVCQAKLMMLSVKLGIAREIEKLTGNQE